MFKRPERPLKFNAGMGIGKALELGGNYYNELAIQKLNQQALEESRAYQTEERIAGQDFQREMEEERQQYQTNAANILHGRNVAASELAHERTVAREDRGYSTVDTGDTVQWGSLPPAIQAAWGQESGKSEEELAAIDPTRPFLMSKDSDGNILRTSGPNVDYHLIDGIWQETSQVRSGGNLGGQTEAEAKYGIYGFALGSAIDELRTVLLPHESGGMGYNLNSLSSKVEQIAGVLSPVGGNFFVSDAGQVYQNALNHATEALFKGWSGAAGSNEEARRYASMFPQPGDSAGVISVKLEMVDQLVDRFKIASGMFPNDENYMSKSSAERLAQDNALVTRMYNEADQIATQHAFNIDLNRFETYAPGGGPVITSEDDDLNRIMNTTYGSPSANR